MIRIGVIRGGVSNEYDVSLASGANILRVITEKLSDKYTPVDVFLSKDGEFHVRGRVVSAAQLPEYIDVAWNALHGAYGEDGGLARALAIFKIPFVGTPAEDAARAHHKLLAKEMVKSIGIKTAPHVDFTVSNNPEELVRFVHSKLSPPWVLKPISGGSSLGVTIARTMPELMEAIKENEGREMMVEEFITGREATVATIRGFRGEDVYSFLPIEIRVPDGKFFDYEHKYDGTALEISPARFALHEQKELEESAKKIHHHLGLRHIARSDFIVSPRGVYFLEVNSSPGMTPMSLVPKSLDPVGATLHEVIDHAVSLAIMGK